MTHWLKSIFDLIEPTTPLERLAIICWLRTEESTGSVKLGKARENSAGWSRTNQRKVNFINISIFRPLQISLLIFYIIYSDFVPHAVIALYVFGFTNSSSNFAHFTLAHSLGEW